MLRLIFIGVIFFSCKSKEAGLQLEEINTIEIKDYQSDLIYVEIDKENIDDFREVLKEKPEEIECRPNGSIYFKKDGEIKLKMEFSNHADCLFLIPDPNSKKISYRLTYRAGMYLGELFYELKKKKTK